MGVTESVPQLMRKPLSAGPLAIKALEPVKLNDCSAAWWLLELYIMTRVQVTAVSGFIELVGKGIPRHNYHLSTPSQFHRASTDTCQLANKHQFICIHLLAIIQFRTNCQQMDAYELVYVG